MLNEVFTCKTPDCERFLYNGKALLEIIVADKTYAINPMLKHFEYAHQDTAIETALDSDRYKIIKSVLAVCPHCKKLAPTDFIDFEIQVDKDNLIKELDELDSQIDEMLLKIEQEEAAAAVK